MFTGWKALVAAAIIGGLLGAWLSPGRAYASSDLNSAPKAQQVGPCAEAWQYPHSKRAKECRKAGWTISLHGKRQHYPRGVVISPHAIPRYINLPPCAVEDGSSGPLPCAWNIVKSQTTGNGRGLAYWIGARGRTHYVWAHPAGRGWRSISHSIADAIAEGDLPHATTRKWERCRVNLDRNILACPNGDRFQAA